MYIRMLVLMIISLFTSRIILQSLGIEDYGIYNVVFGMVVLFAFVNSAMATGTQRHLSYELGKENGNIAKVFSACLYIHIFLAVIIGIFAEIGGSWFLNTQMNIPADRMFAANFVFQIAVVSTIISIVRVPYDASVIAWEKFSYYALISVVEGIFKLFVAFVIYYCYLDKLIVYSILQLGVICIIFIVLVFYCHQDLGGLRLLIVKDKTQYKYLLSFSGWTLFGSAAVVGETQGLNLIVNIFYGVTVNAAAGIANQVRGIVQQFTIGFQSALNPQLIKAQASSDRTRQIDLISKSSKFSFYILVLITLPLMVNMGYVLHLWLGVVPPYAAIITNLGLVVALIEVLSSPLYTTIFAVGRIRNYQLSVTFLRCVSVISAYVICSINASPYYVYTAPCVVAFGLFVYRLFFVSDEIKMRIKDYSRIVLIPIIKTFMIGCVPVLLYKIFKPKTNDVMELLVESLFFISYLGICIFILGLSNSERYFIISTVKNKWVLLKSDN